VHSVRLLFYLLPIILVSFLLSSPFSPVRY
jgi:hypothetical protein